MAVNGSGDWADREIDMLSFEKLPRELRDLLNEAPIALDATEAHTMRRRYGLDDAELVQEYKERVAAYQTSITRATYPGHPQIEKGSDYDTWPCRARYPAHKLRYRRDRGRR